LRKTFTLQIYWKWIIMNFLSLLFSGTGFTVGMK
jgi:hypothetical protein